MNSKLTFKRGLELKNRIMMAPMTTKMSFYDGVVTSDEINYYALRSGEIGAVITGAANVQNDGKGWEGELSVASDAFIPGLSKLAAAIKKNGTKAILQIFFFFREGLPELFFTLSKGCAFFLPQGADIFKLALRTS